MALCGHLVAHDSVHRFLAEHRQRLFPDDMFVDLFGSGRGRPSVPADVVATVMVLQALGPAAVGLLALVAGQDVEPGDSDGSWRIAQVTRPDRIVSVNDPESRRVHRGC